MGFTHYFYQKEKTDVKVWDALCKDTLLLLESADIRLTYVGDGICDNVGFLINDKEINFNGTGAQAHENVYFQKDLSIDPEGYATTDGHERYFSFCKTARKPYDKYVTAFLLLAKFHMEDDIRIQSDGDVSDWQEGIKLVNKIFEYDVRLKEHPEGTWEQETPDLDFAEITFGIHETVSMDEFEKEL